MITLLVCAYCERSIDDIMAEQPGVGPDEALRCVLIGDNRVQLCSVCAEGRPAMTEAEMWSLLNGPTELPPGTVAVDHTCPMLLYDGFGEEEATMRLELEPLDEKPGYLYAHCKECGMSIISEVVTKKEDATDE